MTQAIRLSPSGPVIQNANGGTMVPGPGARLRLVEASCTIGGTLAITPSPETLGPVLGGPALTVSLPNPQGGLEYRVTALLDVFNTSTNVTASVELYLDLSTDGGATWPEKASNTHLVGFTGARQVRCDMKLAPGGSLGVGAGVTSLIARARIGASAGTPNVLAESAGTPGDAATSVGTVLLQLEECL